MWGVGLFQFQNLLSFDLVINSHNRLTSTSDKFGPIPIEVNTIKLLVNRCGIIFHGA